MLPSPVRFTSHLIEGAGRGRQLEVPTMNVNVKKVPPDLDHGIYACRVFLQPNDMNTWVMGAAHYGARPVFHDSVSFEVHVIDHDVLYPPDVLTIEIVARIRDVQNFENVEALKAAIADDVKQARAILRI